MGHRSEKGRHLRYRYRTGMLENIPVPGQIQVSDQVDVIVTNSVSDPGFFRIRISLFFLSLDPDRPKIRIRSGKIRIRIGE